MNEIQLPLFRETPPLLDAALAQLNHNVFDLPNQEDFIRLLGKSMTSALSGAVILAAAPSHDWIHPMLSRYLDDAQKHQVGNGSASICRIDIPSAVSARSMQHRLLEAYQDASRLKAANRNCAPQIEMQFDWSQLSRDPFSVVTGLVAHRPYDYYILHKAGDLVRSGSNAMESVEHVRFIIKMAEMMDRTHVIIASPGQINRWLRNEEIAESTDLCLLKPYDINDPASLEIFLGVLNSFDGLIPWRDQERLAGCAADINEHVWGCPFRLQAWIRKALLAASAKGDTHLSWQLFLENRPIATIRGAAQTDFKAVQELCGPKVGARKSQVGTSIKPTAKYRPVKPGQRKPVRDDVGVDAA